MDSVRELGQKIANPSATGNSFFKATVICGCDGDNTPCQDKLDVTLTAAQELLTIAAVKIDDNVIVLDPQPSTVGNAAIRKAIATAFLTVETCVSVCVVFDDDTKSLSIEHIGQTTLAEVHLSDGTILVPTRCCNLVINTKYQGFVVGAGNVVSFNAVDCPLPSDYAWTPVVDATDPADAGMIANEAMAATLATELEACLVTLGIDANGIEVLPSLEDEGFVVNYNSTNCEKVTVGDVAFQNCGTSEAFICD